MKREHARILADILVARQAIESARKKCVFDGVVLSEVGPVAGYLNWAAEELDNAETHLRAVEKQNGNKAIVHE
jgi:hypothetical protein